MRIGNLEAIAYIPNNNEIRMFKEICAVFKTANSTGEIMWVLGNMIGMIAVTYKEMEEAKKNQ